MKNLRAVARAGLFLLRVEYLDRDPGFLERTHKAAG